MLRDIGGRNIEEFVSRVVSQVMGNDFALLYNFTERNGKESFKKWSIMSKSGAGKVVQRKSHLRKTINTSALQNQFTQSNITGF